jgi:hypothetical protein
VEPQDRRNQQVGSEISATGARRHAMRLLRDESDGIVLAYELTGSAASDPSVLVLEWEGGKSIARNGSYPANWRDLKDSALLELRRQDS